MFLASHTTVKLAIFTHHGKFDLSYFGIFGKWLLIVPIRGFRNAAGGKDRRSKCESILLRVPWGGALTQRGWFFTKAALVTFGSAYRDNFVIIV